MEHPVLNKTAVLSNSLSNSVAATESARKYYFARNKKIQNQIVVQLKSIVKMAKSDEATETKVATKKNSGGNKEKQKPPTKIVIRHLPPTMSEEEFLKQIDPLPPHDFYYFAAADWSLGFDATCRAYITLKNYDDVFLFRDRFDGYVFVDAKGNEYAAIVEFAPFQGILKNKSRRSDNKVNTIEEEAHYQQFLLKLAEEREIASKGGETKMEFNLNAKKEEITSTPLLQYLANKKEKRRLEAKKRVEEKRKQRDEEKEKRRQTQIPDNVKETQLAPEVVVVKKEQKSVGEIEEKQNSRSKRRIERNQKRQEAFLQRKMQDKAAKSSESAEQVAVTEKTEQTQQRDKKESRRERDRERERERNRLRRERREKAKELAKGNNDVIKVTPKILTKQDGETTKKEEKEEEVISVNRPNSSERSEAKCDEETKKQQRAAEERRIRNKDRPSIAIYQPKARLRQSEESDTGGNNSAGGRQSDGERLADTKKAEETTQVKKVSRYSERRKRSAAKEKRKSSATDEEIVTKEDVVSSLTEAQ